MVARAAAANFAEHEKPLVCSFAGQVLYPLLLTGTVRPQEKLKVGEDEHGYYEKMLFYLDHEMLDHITSRSLWGQVLLCKLMKFVETRMHHLGIWDLWSVKQRDDFIEHMTLAAMLAVSPGDVRRGLPHPHMEMPLALSDDVDDDGYGELIGLPTPLPLTSGAAKKHPKKP